MTDDDGSSLYAWQVEEPDGRWSMVGASIGAMGSQVPLIHRDLDFVKQLRPLATAHAEATEQPLRLVHFRLVEVIEEQEVS